MKYSELTKEQQADLAAYDKFLRGTLVSLMAVQRAAEPAMWQAFAVANVDPILAQLDGKEEIPNATSLGRAKSLTVTEFKELQSMARGLVQLAQSSLPTIVKAIGCNAE